MNLSFTAYLSLLSLFVKIEMYFWFIISVMFEDYEDVVEVDTEPGLGNQGVLGMTAAPWSVSITTTLPKPTTTVTSGWSVRISTAMNEMRPLVEDQYGGQRPAGFTDDAEAGLRLQAWLNVSLIFVGYFLNNLCLNGWFILFMVK